VRIRRKHLIRVVGLDVVKAVAYASVFGGSGWVVWQLSSWVSADPIFPTLLRAVGAFLMILSFLMACSLAVLVAELPQLRRHWNLMRHARSTLAVVTDSAVRHDMTYGLKQHWIEFVYVDEQGRPTTAEITRSEDPGLKAGHQFTVLIDSKRPKKPLIWAEAAFDVVSPTEAQQRLR